MKDKKKKRERIPGKLAGEMEGPVPFSVRFRATI